jgi:sigma-E factor negative regulatory protein RseC
MIEENARVIAIEGDIAWVETRRKSTCGSCSAKNSCGSSLLERFVGQRSNRLAVSRVDNIEEGDEVVLGLEESSLLRGSFAVYMLPLLLMLLLAVLAQTFLSDKWLASEAASILGGMVGLGLGLFWLKAYAKRALIDGRFRPVVLRRVTGNRQSNSVNVINRETT